MSSRYTIRPVYPTRPIMNGTGIFSSFASQIPFVGPTLGGITSMFGLGLRKRRYVGKGKKRRTKK